MIRLEGMPTAISEIKRLHIYGIKVYSNCPQCNAEVCMDLSDQHLSLSCHNLDGKLYFGHECNDEEESEWIEKISLKIEIIQKV